MSNACLVYLQTGDGEDKARSPFKYLSGMYRSVASPSSSRVSVNVKLFCSVLFRFSIYLVLNLSTV